MNTDKNSTWLRPLTGPEEAEQLQAAARADGHDIFMPRFVLTRARTDRESGIANSEIIGGVGAWPVWQCWLHTEKARAMDTVRALKQLEARVRGNGVPAICLPCTAESPFRPMMDRLGYQHWYDAGLFFKPLV